MISKTLALSVLNQALATGADAVELFLEDTVSESISLDNGKVETVGSKQTYGAGLRLMKGLQSVYGFTSDLSKKSLLNLASSLSASFEGTRLISVSSFKANKVKVINKITDHLLDVPAAEKIPFLKDLYEAARSVDERIVRVTDSFACDFTKTVVFYADSEIGSIIKNTEERGRISMMALAAENGKIETARESPGAYDGWSFFTKKIDAKSLAVKTAETAIKFLNAKECPSGRYPVVIGNGWGGVIFHEACGHSLEATATAKKMSVFADSIGKQIASPIVSAYDDGTIPNMWGSNNVDSEGRATQKNQLIKDGVCVGFLVDRFNARRLKMTPNGVSRRESYRYEPTSRMSNTYIAPGKDKAEDIIKDTKLGIYVTNFGGGSVNPPTGEFNFTATEAYIIRDGKIEEPVRGCTLIGSGKEVLMSIDRVADDLDFGVGQCGSVSGSVPVTVGQPTIRISEITVGGQGGKLE